MSKQQQIQKNIDLSKKLAEFLAQNATIMDDKPENISYVVFSSHDEALNKINMKLLQSLLQEGRTVIKAEETRDKNNPWKFIPAVA